MRTEPPSPRQSVLAGSASRHVITTWEKTAGTTPAPRPTRRIGPANTARSCARICLGCLRAPAALHTQPHRSRTTPRFGWPGVGTRPCLAGPENLVGPLGSFIGALPDLHAAEQDIIAEQQATQAVFTGFLDRSVLYDVLAHMEMLGLDLVEVQRVMKTERHPAPRNPA
jgi:hypothetical protein